MERITQLLNNTELVTQSAQMLQQVQYTLQQVQMAQSQLKNLQTLGNFNWTDLSGSISTLNSAVNRGQALGYSLGSIDQKFSQQYTGYSAGQSSMNHADYQQASADWSQENMDSIHSALRSASIQADGFSDEQSTLSSIRSQAEGSQGSLQIAQAGVQVASLEVDQLQKLRQLFMSQMQAQNSYLATQVQQKAEVQTQNQNFFKSFTPAGSSFNSSGGRN
jgi:P-type conjugative transfer protein TrbJ